MRVKLSAHSYRALKMSGKSITKRAFLKKLAAKIDSFGGREEASKYFGVPKEFLHQIRTGQRTASAKVQEAMGYQLHREVTTVDRYIELGGDDEG